MFSKTQRAAMEMILFIAATANAGTNTSGAGGLYPIEAWACSCCSGVANAR
jgi:hypothetical protein